MTMSVVRFAIILAAEQRRLFRYDVVGNRRNRLRDVHVRVLKGEVGEAPRVGRWSGGRCGARGIPNAR